MSKIEWTNETWNPIIGCSKVSAGCKNCYAEKMAYRLACMEDNRYKYGHVIDTYVKWLGITHFVESQLEKPFRWKKPRMIFVCSMGDLFHESVSFEWIDKVIDVIRWNKQHTFQILTKRPERMEEYFNKRIPCKYIIDAGDYLDNIWLGVTAENQEQANKRIPILLQIPAKVRFVSVEPMLDGVDLTNIQETDEFSMNSLHTENALDWVIFGGESGHNARPMHPNWVRNLKDQCEAASVPFFFKQWGEWHESDLQENTGYKTHLWFDGKLMCRVGKKKAGCSIYGKEYKQFPDM